MVMLSPPHTQYRGSALHKLWTKGGAALVRALWRGSGRAAAGASHAPVGLAGRARVASRLMNAERAASQADITAEICQAIGCGDEVEELREA